MLHPIKQLPMAAGCTSDTGEQAVIQCLGYADPFPLQSITNGDDDIYYKNERTCPIIQKYISIIGRDHSQPLPCKAAPEELQSSKLSYRAPPPGKVTPAENS